MSAIIDLGTSVTIFRDGKVVEIEETPKLRTGWFQFNEANLHPAMLGPLPVSANAKTMFSLELNMRYHHSLWEQEHRRRWRVGQAVHEALKVKEPPHVCTLFSQEVFRQTQA